VRSASFSQDCGATTINSAQEYYFIGRFDESIDILSKCLLTAQGFNSDEKIRAYHLLALCYLAIDSTNSADSSIEELLALKDNFEPDLGDPERFSKELKLVKSTLKRVIVSSVSKRNEDIRHAAATVIVITQAEMIQRGYNDLIEVLKDIPGFDITIYYGQTYANIYQRGLRTNFTGKTLIMVDGVEDNDLWSYFADISQQYPITNIKRVEVVYGPSSTMYGPNAFSGVINIITKSPEDYINKGLRSFGIKAAAGAGSYSTQYIDVSASFKKGIFSMSLTGRFYNSSRPDLSSQEWWDYDPSFFDEMKYNKVLDVTTDAQKYIEDNHLPLSSKLYNIKYDASGNAESIILSENGRRLADSLDQQAYRQTLNGARVGKFTNKARAAYIQAKINIGDISLGFVSWEKTEGAGTTYTDRAASVNGTKWIPSHAYMYASLDKRISQKISFSGFLNYRIHTIHNGSKITEFHNYANNVLQIKDLVDTTLSTFVPKFFYEQSEQFRSEFKLSYTRNKYFYLLGGLELRNSQLQGYYLVSDSSNPQQYGAYVDSLPGGNEFNVNDAGLYAEGKYTTKKGMSFTLGARLDYNQIKQEEGLGFTLSPRVVIDKEYKNWIFKAIFSKGIENVSNFTKFNDFGRLIPNPGLKAESIFNYEVSISNQINKAFMADADFYFSDVKNVVEIIRITTLTRRNINSGEFKIFGIQSNVYYKSEKFQASVNYSYTYPRQTKDTTGNVDLVVADIAPHKANMVANYIFLKHYNINLRVNYVGAKRAGVNTTVKANSISFFDSYIINSLTLSVQDIFKLKGSTFQFVCSNIFNKVYYSPGISTAGGNFYPGSILQMGRNFSCRIIYEF
jgi:outer membrane receptor for ferrienterochelin and colicin